MLKATVALAQAKRFDPKQQIQNLRDLHNCNTTGDIQTSNNSHSVNVKLMHSYDNSNSMCDPGGVHYKTEISVVNSSFEHISNTIGYMQP